MQNNYALPEKSEFRMPRIKMQLKKKIQLIYLKDNPQDSSKFDKKRHVYLR